MTGTAPAPAFARALQAAADAQRRGDQAAAGRHLDEALRLEPEQPLALNMAGTRALAAGDAARAADYFARAAAADPDAPPLWMNLANAHRQRGDAPAEQAALLRALALDQRHLMASIRLAELHERLGENAAAAQRWSAAIAASALLPELPPGLQPVLAHAQDFVREQGRAFAEAIDDGLAEVRAPLDAADRRRFDACVDAMLGRRRIYENDCHGLRFPFLPADEFFDSRLFPWLGEVEARTPAIRAELEGLLRDGRGLEPYVAMAAGTPRNKWSTLDQSLDWSAFYLWRYGERIADACARCPETAAMLDTVPRADMPRRGPTAFFSILKPRTRLPAHSGVSNARAIVHLPLVVPPGCGFRVGGETREWRVGEAFAFDDTIEHEAWNDSDELRAVLIFDTWNPHLSAVERDLLRRFFELADASGHDPAATAVAE